MYVHSIEYSGPAINSLVHASAGSTVTVEGTVACGSSGVTNVFAVTGGTIYDKSSSITGTYTNRHSQVPNQGTEEGIIYAASSTTVQTSAATSGTVTVLAGKKTLKLTGALAATLTIDCTALADDLVVYSTNGVTALTISGGTPLGFMPGISAGGIINIIRSDTELWVS
jgi:hypothetical protein